MCTRLGLTQDSSGKHNDAFIRRAGRLSQMRLKVAFDQTDMAQARLWQQARDSTSS